MNWILKDQKSKQADLDMISESQVLSNDEI